MKTKIFKFSMIFVAILTMTLVGCNNDDDNDGPDPTCTDGIQNGDEEGVDCGGSCQPCEMMATCDDGVQNGDEEGVDCGGSSCNACPVESVDLTGDITEDTTLDPAVEYTLAGPVSVQSGVTLTIPAGTTITANAASGDETDTYIVVQQGGSIDVQGTAANPVVMTSNDEDPGDWGGLVIAGEATTTEGVDATAEVGGIIYGGTDDADSSGSINYLIINYAGASINSESQYNGLSLYAVGSGTTISNVAILNGTDDGVEFFGGTVSASNFYLENNEDDAIDWTEGWNGTLTDAYVLHTAAFSTVVEADGENENPSLVNLTAASTVGGTALQFKKESGATITGLALSGYDTSVVFSDGGDPANAQINGADADPSLSYIGDPTVDINIFDWVGSALEPPANQLSGSVASNLTLDPAVDYFLKGDLSIEAGATLTIPAGTRITADVESGEETNTYIVVQQGGSIDVQGTAADPVIMTSVNETPGDWGGLVIAGEASTTEGVDAVAEVGGIIYGGTDDANNSGSINYLIINYAGASINSESQYNGLSLYAVGSGTTISNVAILNGTDDGVEFFGGTVSASNFYLENNEDDAIDWTEGWNGTLTDAYVLHTAPFSTVVEADGENENPSLVNLTAVSSVGGTALQFKKESGATITGLSLTGYDTSVVFSDGGDPANAQIEGADADPAEDYAAPATVDINDFIWATGNDESDTAVLTGSVNADLTLNPSIRYLLNQNLSVENGATLTIPAGTEIVADVQTGEETNTYIVVQQGGSIDIQGTAANPVVMTSANQEPGDWGGLVIAGEASTTEGVDAVAEVGGIIYGGTDDADSSGSINYLIINYAGASINSESQYNGLSLYAVGSGTTISNVAILNGTDDGVEFFGGTVSASNFYLENNEDDAIDWTEGWNGTLTDAYVLHTAAFSTVVEADGENENPSLVNLTARSTVGGTALQFKKESGATITGLSLDGYDTSVVFSDGGDPANAQIEGADADPALTYEAPATVDINGFTWATGNDETQSATLTGSVMSDLTLDPSITYFLNQNLSVMSGATLTIPAGTTIIADVEGGDETNTYIVVQQGGSIDVQGTAADPVVMTSSNETPGDWGGLVIAGEATTTEGVDAVAEVGGIIYGGTDDADNSGSINYLIINYAGASINSESQYNGLSLYAVGSGTTISNVAILNGTDDGVEFFGGTVSASNFYLENNEDDAIDWTEGWNGTLTDAYVLHTAPFSTVVEADGENENPSLVNLTAVSSVGGTALQFKKESGATITGLSLTGYDTSVVFSDGGDPANAQIEGADADPALDYDAAATVDVADFAWATN